MKIHLTVDGKKSVCGCAENAPDKWLYYFDGFIGHYAEDMKCKKCNSRAGDMALAKKYGLREFNRLENTVFILH